MDTLNVDRSTGSTPDPEDGITDASLAASNRALPHGTESTRSVPPALLELAQRERKISTDPVMQLVGHHIAESSREELADMVTGALVSELNAGSMQRGQANAAIAGEFPPAYPLRLDDLAIVFGEMKALALRSLRRGYHPARLYEALYAIDISSTPMLKLAINISQAARFVSENTGKRYKLVDLVFNVNARQLLAVARAAGEVSRGTDDRRSLQVDIVEEAVVTIRQLFFPHQSFPDQIRIDGDLLRDIAKRALNEKDDTGKAEVLAQAIDGLVFNAEGLLDIYTEIQLAKHFRGTDMSLRAWRKMSEMEKLGFAATHCRALLDYLV